MTDPHLVAADPHARLREHADLRREAGLRRTLTPREHDDASLDLAGNDYLGLSRDPRVVEAAVDAVRRWGAGSTGSRLVTGSTRAHHELEEALAAHVGVEAALVLSSGYLANLAAVTSLAGDDTLVVSEAQNHASLIDACRLSRARTVVAPHGDVEAVDRALRATDADRSLLVTDSVFSVDGGLAPLAALADLARQHEAVLLDDEAHALGVVGSRGQGAAAAAGLTSRDEVVLTATLSKALGSQGGVILGPRVVIDHVIDTARPFIFDTALAPAAVAARPPSGGGGSPGQFDSYVFSLEWTAAFCEGKPGLPECANRKPDRFDAKNLALHGLWPDQNGDSPKSDDLRLTVGLSVKF